MNWGLILITTIIVFILLMCFENASNKSNPVTLLDKNIKELKHCINRGIFTKEEIYVHYAHEEQIRFEKTKNNLLNKCNYVSSIICDMVNLYCVDAKILQFYSKQINSLNNLISEIEQHLTELSKNNNCKDYQLSETGKIIFNKLNNKLNKHITSFIVGNAKFFTSLKFINKKDADQRITMEEYLKTQKKTKLLKSVLNLIVSILIGILTNYISGLIGL